MMTAARSVTRAPPATWPPSNPPPGSLLTDAEARRRGAGTSASSSSRRRRRGSEPADQLFPAATQIVDLTTPVSASTNSLTSPPGYCAKATQTGSPNGSLNSTPRHPRPAHRATRSTSSARSPERDKQLGYFEDGAHRMRYACFRQPACSSAPAPSKQVQAVIGQRLKLPACDGPGATAIATLRCQKPAAAGSRSAAATQPDSHRYPAICKRGTWRPPQAEPSYLQIWRTPTSTKRSSLRKIQAEGRALGDWRARG